LKNTRLLRYAHSRKLSGIATYRNVRLIPHDFACPRIWMFLTSLGKTDFFNNLFMERCRRNFSGKLNDQPEGLKQKIAGVPSDLTGDVKSEKIFIRIKSIRPLPC